MPKHFKTDAERLLALGVREQAARSMRRGVLRACWSATAFSIVACSSNAASGPSSAGGIAGSVGALSGGVGGSFSGGAAGMAQAGSSSESGTAGIAPSGGSSSGGIGGAATAGAGGLTAVGGTSAGASGTGDSGSAGVAGAAAGPPVLDLFNGSDLTGFDVYMETTEKAPGKHLTAQQALSIFKPENGTLHVYADAPDQSTQVHYTLVTNKAYSKYNLSWQYKWGTKKFAPYTDLQKYPRDAGVLWHLHGDITQLWPSSIEFQNKDGTTGDVFSLYARCTSLGAPSMKTVFADTSNGGVSVLVDGSNGFVQHSRSANFEIANDWNSLLLQVDGGTAVYTVNGHIVNRVLSVMDKNGNPVTSGPIAWQAEQAEVFYRNLRIQVLP